MSKHLDHTSVPLSPRTEMGIEELYTPVEQKTGVYISVALHRRRIRSIAFFISVLCAGLLTRLGYLQIVMGPTFRELADQNRIRPAVHLARRGVITDRFGTPMVENTPSFLLIAKPPLLPENQTEIATLIDELSSVIGIDPEDLTVLGNASALAAREVSLGVYLEYQQALQFELNKERFPGIDLQVFANRSYPIPLPSLSHILGYVSPTSIDDIKRNPLLKPLSFTGKSGIELEYDRELRGVDGATLWEYDARGERQRALTSVAAVDGPAMKTSLSLPLQWATEQTLRAELKRSGRSNGSVVVMKASTGEILSLVSIPSFDLNVFSSPNRSSDRRKLLADPEKSLFFRAIAGQYPSGSTIKPFIAAIALEQGVIDRSVGVESTGGIRVGQSFFPDWSLTGHGWTTVVKALAQSVNTYFYLIVGGDGRSPALWKGTPLGIDRLRFGLEQFGWGSTTGIDLAGEASGFVPTPQWKLSATGVRWFIGDSYLTAIGQGDILVTPLQLATATARLAVNNSNVRPWIVRPTNRALTSPIASDDAISIVKEGMRLAVTDGTARRLNTVRLPIFAKTGTAQGRQTDEPHSWVTSFVDIGGTPVVVTVLVERGGEGSGSAVSVAQLLYQFLRQKPEVVR